MNNYTITVFTPTYNRINLLPQCYESLKRQTCRDFLWLVIDDGSTDGTDALVARWMEEADFEIRCIRKENGGLHTAYNAAIQALDTELAVCVDSDDYLTDDAIERITALWRTVPAGQFAGIVALNRTPEQAVLGAPLPDLPAAHLIDLYCTYHCRSDLKMIYRTDLLKSQGPIPTFGNEKHMNPYYLFLKIDKLLPMRLLRQPVCVVNYQPEGMSSEVLRHYVESPRSFAALRQMMVSMDRAPRSYTLKHAIHLVSSALFAGDPALLRAIPRRWIAILSLVPGLILHLAIRAIYRIKYGAK